MSRKGINIDTVVGINEIRGWRLKRKTKLPFGLKLINKRTSTESSFSKRRNIETKRICNKWIDNVFKKKSCRAWKNEHRERKAWLDDSKQAKERLARKRAIENPNQLA